MKIPRSLPLTFLACVLACGGLVNLSAQEAASPSTSENARTRQRLIQQRVPRKGAGHVVIDRPGKSACDNKGGQFDERNSLCIFVESASE